jgi:hypothetical protein
MICDRCYQPLDTGEHGQYLCPMEPRRVGAAVIDDSIEGGPRFFETMDHDAPWIATKTDLRRECDKRNLRIKDDRCPSWAAGIDAYTLESAAILLSRGSRNAEAPSPGKLETLKTEINDIKKWSDVR